MMLFFVLIIQGPKLPITADELRKRIASLPKLLAAWRPSPGAGLLWQNLGNFLRSEEIAGLVGNE